MSGFSHMALGVDLCGGGRPRQDQDLLVRATMKQVVRPAVAIGQLPGDGRYYDDETVVVGIPGPERPKPRAAVVSGDGSPCARSPQESVASPSLPFREPEPSSPLCELSQLS
jgi:hypothetical protein